MTEKAGLVASPHQPMPKPGTTEAAVAPPRGRRPRRCSGERKIMAAFFSLSLDRRVLSTTAAAPRGRPPPRRRPAAAVHGGAPARGKFTVVFQYVPRNGGPGAPTW